LNFIQTPLDFGAAVRAERKARHFTQSELAERAGVGRPWLSELETGKRTAEIGRALKVVAALNLAVAFVPAPAMEEPPEEQAEVVWTSSQG
jgi:y4mF family transcriptional regulator